MEMWIGLHLCGTFLIGKQIHNGIKRARKRYKDINSEKRTATSGLVAKVGIVYYSDSGYDMHHKQYVPL